MKIAGIAAEYNPFHNGHQYQLNKVREETGADRILVVMSGDFVQRGSAAITDKYVRTRMALAGGADLVLELPVIASTGSAEYFASGAIRILDSLGCVDVLSFGCENPDTEPLLFLADFFDREPESYRAYLQRHLSGGMTFPASREMALRDFIASDEAQEKDLLPLDPENTPSLLRSPNNILAVEYLRALRRLKSRIEPVPIERTDSGFRSLSPDSETGLSSANALRRLIAERNTSWKSEIVPYIPQESRKELPDDLWDRMEQERRSYDLLLHYRLMSDPDLSRYLDVSPDMEKRIQNLLPMYRTADRFLSLLKTRQVTEARCRRALLHIVLKITDGLAALFRAEDTKPYARILGFRKESEDLLHTIRESCGDRITLIPRVSQAQDLLDENQRRLFDLDLRAAHIYELLTAPEDEPIRSEYHRMMIKR